MFERSEELRKLLAELNEEQRKEFGDRLNKKLEELCADREERLIKYYNQQYDKELKEYMEKYTNETIHIKSLFRKKEILYTTYNLTYGLEDPTMKKIVKNIRAEFSMAKCPNIKLIFYNDEKRNDEYRCEKHERMLRYMRHKYPIEY